MRLILRTLLPALVAVACLLAVAGSAFADSQTYVVQRGDTLFKISVRFGVSMDAIRSANGLTGDRIYAGQSLIIPDPNAQAQAPAAPAAGSTIHVVQRGETLFTIGLQHNLTWTRLQAANNLPSTTVYVGQRLVIPVTGSSANPPADPAPTPPPADAAPTPAPTEPPAAAGGEVIYIVQPGDTLARIGQAYGVSWTAIQAANELASDQIYTGQRLVIPSADGQPAPTVVAPPPPAENLDGKRFLVDLSEQRLYAYEGDTMVRTTLISSGTWQHPTVTGTFYIYLRYASTRMRGPDYDLPNVPYTMYFYKGYGLHGTYWHNNFGHPMSHGCVNMPTSEAEWAYNWSTYGTPVIVQP
jgi:LysM repeat protein